MGEDNRITPDARDLTYSAVVQTGRIYIAEEEFVSGILTGANCDVVVSAGHAAIYWQNVPRKGWRKGKIRGGGEFSFALPGQGFAQVKMSLVVSGFQHADGLGNDEYDWSIFRLDKPITQNCNEIVITEPNKCKSNLIMPAWHFDRQDSLLVDKSCDIKDILQKKLLVHDCDSKEGSSGAPLLCLANDEAAVVAINVSGLTNKEYYDPGVYGEQGARFDPRQHKNFAVLIQGMFANELTKELRLSRARKEIDIEKKHKNYDGSAIISAPQNHNIASGGLK